MVWFSNSLFARHLSCPSAGLSQLPLPASHCKATLEADVSDPTSTSNFLLYFFYSKAGTEITFQNIEILQETNWPFSILVRKPWAGREGSKQALHGSSSSLEVFAHQEQCTVQKSCSTELISDGRCTAINCFSNHGLLNISSAVVPEGFKHGLWVWWRRNCLHSSACELCSGTLLL